MNSRTKNTVINFISVIVVQSVLFVINLFTRKIILNYIGVEVLGADGLFTTIINLQYYLEFGICTSAVYYLIKAFAKEDKKEVTTVFYSFRRLYSIISLIIIAISIVVVIDINFFVTQTNLSVSELRTIFILVSINRLIGFLVIPYRNLIFCNQKQSTIQLISFAIGLSSSVVKLLFISLTKSYYVYLICIIIEAIITLIVYIGKSKSILEKDYNPDLKEKTKEIFDYAKKVFITNTTTGLFVSKDNIIISRFCTNALGQIGLLSNYNIIFLTINSIAEEIMNSIKASIMNYINDESVNYEENVYSIFNIMLFFSFVIGLFCVIGLYALSSQFIALMFGQQFTMSEWLVLFMSLNIAMVYLITSFSIYNQAKGQIEKEIKCNIPALIISIIASIYFVKLYGVVGVHIGTFIGYLFKLIFVGSIVAKSLKANKTKMITKTLLYIFIMVIDCILINMFAIKGNIEIISIIKNIGICALIFIGSLLIFINSDESKLIINTLKSNFARGKK